MFERSQRRPSIAHSRNPSVGRGYVPGDHHISAISARLGMSWQGATRCRACRTSGLLNRILDWLNRA